MGGVRCDERMADRGHSVCTGNKFAASRCETALATLAFNNSKSLFVFPCRDLTVANLLLRAVKWSLSNWLLVNLAQRI